MSAGLPRVDATWRALMGRLERPLPWFHAELTRDDRAGTCPEPRPGRMCRQFAWCRGGDYEGQIPVVGVSGRMERLPVENIEGVLAHELGHAILLSLGYLNHTERDADDAAESWLQTRISYDKDDVQTTGAGTRPRPRRLG